VLGEAGQLASASCGPAAPFAYFAAATLGGNGQERFLYGVGILDVSYTPTVQQMDIYVRSGSWDDLGKLSAEQFIPFPLDLFLLLYGQSNPGFDLWSPQKW